MFGERVPESGGSYREGSPGSVLGPGRWSQEVCIRSAEAAGWIVAMEQVSEVGRGLVMEGFVCEEEDFKLNTLWNWEPVEVLEDRSDVMTGRGVGKQTCNRVLDVL